MSAILAIVHRTNTVFKLERELDGSNPFMKFGRNPIENKSDNGKTDRQTDMPKTIELHQHPLALVGP